MVSKVPLNIQTCSQVAEVSPPVASLGTNPSHLNHDYAEADILRLSTFFRSNPNPILVFSPDGNVVKTNPAAVRMLKRLHMGELDLLPEDHAQIVQSCLDGRMREYAIEVNTHNRVFALTYHPLPAFKLVYLYAIEITEFRRAEEDLLRMVASTLTLAKQAVLRLQAFRKTPPQSVKPSHQQTDLSEMFVAMDGCVFTSSNRFGEWDLD
ncbi:hypothetical protein J5X98_18660 [Leptothermofonsia sichuanensis E412]|uniref:PAS domain-containing protein n=1 Tax=Leptothermofonsia sichuanensis TaxID=2917832 RepID=UPI001CA645B9|nr:PAS domain-containing protein [Leptothermofonsia sichuanensis]QZZ19387.1 hypothetical protein J5X98_18660 [Leptothermofonsia sichuanensis E412]